MRQGEARAWQERARATQGGEALGASTSSAPVAVQGEESVWGGCAREPRCPHVTRVFGGPQLGFGDFGVGGLDFGVWVLRVWG